MKKELQTYIIKKNSIFFSTVGEYQINIDCGDGWFHIINTLFDTINRYYIYKKTQPITVLDIKEKFGILIFRVNGADDYIRGLIQMASSLSYNTCENCGSTDNVGVTDNWVKVLCKDCFDKGNNSHLNWTPHKTDRLLKLSKIMNIKKAT